MKNDIEISTDALIETTEHTSMVGPGRMLREAREAKGLTQKQVAATLNFRNTLVQDIEADKFDLSLPVTFNRGYLKNYAKLVNISLDEVLERYEQLGVAQTQYSDMQSFSRITEKQAENNMLMWITCLIVIILAAATVVWWYQTPSMQPTPTVIHADNDTVSEQSNVASNEGITASNNVAVDDQLEALPFTTAESVIDNAGESDAVVTDETAEKINGLSKKPLVNEETKLEQTLNNSQTSTDTAINDLPNVSEVEQISPELSTINIEDQAVVSTPEEQLSTPANLVFTFSGDCWVNITDGTGERVAWGMKKSGYVMQISGQAPFNITLGRPELVSVDYNDVAVDMSEFNAGNIAKFSLPLKP